VYGSKVEPYFIFSSQNPSYSRLHPFTESWGCSIFQLQVDFKSQRKIKHLIQKNQILGLLSTFFALLFFYCITACMSQVTNEATRNHLATGEAM